MRRIPLDSTAIRNAGYDPKKSQLEVSFASGGTYRYFGVAPEVGRALLEAPSKGRFFHEHVLGRYRFLRLDA